MEVQRLPKSKLYNFLKYSIFESLLLEPAGEDLVALVVFFPFSYLG